MNAANLYRQQVLTELDTFPEEFLPQILQFIKTFKEKVQFKSAKASFEQGWQEAQQGQTFPIEELWDGIDVE